MADLLDLGLVAESRRLLDKLLEARGLGWFLSENRARPFGLEPRSIEHVLRLAIRARERSGAAPLPQTGEHCRQLVRRELIKQVAVQMVRVGL